MCFCGQKEPRIKIERLLGEHFGDFIPPIFKYRKLVGSRAAMQGFGVFWPNTTLGGEPSTVMRKDHILKPLPFDDKKSVVSIGCRQDKDIQKVLNARDNLGTQDLFVAFEPNLGKCVREELPASAAYRLYLDRH